MKTVVISGASGFLGQRLCEFYAQAGWQVRALGRSFGPAQNTQPGITWFSCDLPRRVPEAAFDGPVELFIHGAFEMRFQNVKSAEATNLEGSCLLFELAGKSGVKKRLFISSMSAHSGTLNLYGRHKLIVEGLMDPTRDLIIRPGLIVGNGGVYQRMKESIERLPFIPLFYGGTQSIQTVDVSDVVQGIWNANESGLSGAFNLASFPVAIRAFYAEIAKNLGKQPRFLSLPGGLVLSGLRISEKLGMSLPISSENLLGLKSLRVFECEKDLQQLGLKPFSMVESVRRWK